MRKSSFAVAGLSAASVAAIAFGVVGAAKAADAPLPTKALPLKAPVAALACTGIEEFFTTACQLAWYGIRFYGTIDAGYGYETNGSPFNKLATGGVNYFPGKNSLGGKWLPSPNGLSITNVGVAIKEPLAAGWSFVGQLEARFNPESLSIANGAHTVFSEKGVPLLAQTSYGDSSTQGQIYTNLGFAGVSNDTWGTLTFGRQYTLMGDAIVAYDPMGGSLAFSAIGFFGAWGGGGDTEDGRSTTAFKYRVNYANYHLGFVGQVGGYAQGNASEGAFQGDIGGDFKVGPGLFSTDLVVGHTKDAVGLGISGPTNAAGVPINTNVGGFSNATATATISDNTNILATAKYAVDKLTLYGGYEWIELKNPSDPFAAGTGFTSIGGDYFCAGCTNVNGTNISSTAFNGGKKDFQVAWFGGKYALTSTVTLIAAYYHEAQNNYSGGAKNSAGGTCLTAASALGSCAGSLDAVSAVVDWQFAKKWDTYFGTLYSQLGGGLDSGFLVRSSWSTMGGLRFRW